MALYLLCGAAIGITIFHFFLTQTDLFNNPYIDINKTYEITERYNTLCYAYLLACNKLGEYDEAIDDMIKSSVVLTSSANSFIKHTPIEWSELMLNIAAEHSDDDDEEI